MSASDGSVTNHSRHSMGCTHRGGCGKGKWSGRNIVVMVLAFMLFWPVGLVVLYWILSGRDVKDLPGSIQRKWSQTFGAQSSSPSRSDNVVFDEYQQTQYDRISEIKEEIKDRARRFHEYRADAKRRADEVEFKSFMANNPMRESS